MWNEAHEHGDADVLESLWADDLTPFGVNGRHVMARRTKTLPVLAFVLLAVAPALSQKTLTASEAKDHNGEQATVCGKVVSTGYAENSRGKPTFLNLDKPYPAVTLADAIELGITAISPLALH